MDLWLIFFTGLTIGGVSCMAVQGGLLASTIAAREEEEIEEGKNRKQGVWPTLSFLITKFFAYIILGLVLGGFGAALQISERVQAFMQIAASLYMLAVAMNLLNVHPVFRYVIIQPPRFLTRLVRNQSKSKDLFAPAFLGAMTIFIPCGTTLAMESLAISSGSAIKGAAIMGAFVLGTSPLFFALGYITTTLGDAFRARFLKLAAILIIYLGMTSLNGSLISLGSPITLQSLADASPIQISFGGEEGSDSADTVNTTLVNGVQVVEIQAFPNGYSPTYIKIKNGVPTRINVTATGGYGCTSAFAIPALGVRKRLALNTTVPVEFTPQNKGKILFSCSMGMYSGVIDLI